MKQNQKPIFFAVAGLLLFFVAGCSNDNDELVNDSVNNDKTEVEGGKAGKTVYSYYDRFEKTDTTVIWGTWHVTTWQNGWIIQRTEVKPGDAVVTFFQDGTMEVKYENEMNQFPPFRKEAKRYSFDEVDATKFGYGLTSGLTCYGGPLKEDYCFYHFEDGEMWVHQLAADGYILTLRKLKQE